MHVCDNMQKQIRIHFQCKWTKLVSVIGSRIAVQVPLGSDGIHRSQTYYVGQPSAATGPQHLPLLLRQVSALCGPLSWGDLLKADPDMRLFLPSFLRCFFARFQASEECFFSVHQPLVNLLHVSFHLGTCFLQNLGMCWLLINWY